jgi:galactokinase
MNFFNDNREIFSASAPGRLDVMGGIADYSGSLLLEMPIAKTLTVEVQKRNDQLVCLQSVINKKDKREFQIDLATLENKTPEEAGAVIRSMNGGDWAAYVIGCLVILKTEKNINAGAVNVLIRSGIPIGKGVASSAALEIATLNAICKMLRISLGEIELPVLAQKAENKIAAAACGLMDQLTIQLGKKNKLLPIVCQPHKVFAPIALAKGIQFCGIDSGVRHAVGGSSYSQVRAVRHAVGGSSYSQVRAAAFMAYTVIAKQEGVTARELMVAKKENKLESLPYKGFLANIPVSVFEKKYAAQIPESISGSDFLELHQVSIDDATQVLPETNYKLLACARHPVYENIRVNLFSQLLQTFPKSVDKIKTLELLGELMYQSHAGYSSVGLGNSATDEIVDLTRKIGTGAGVFGARVTGGGSGGTVAALCYGKEGKRSVREIYQQYRKSSGKKLFLFFGSENGAMILNNKHNIKRHEYNSAV